MSAPIAVILRKDARFDNFSSVWSAAAGNVPRDLRTRSWEADEKKLDELAARLNVLEGKVKKL
jgi:hypothetical protein